MEPLNRATIRITNTAIYLATGREQPGDVRLYHLCALHSDIGDGDG